MALLRKLTKWNSSDHRDDLSDLTVELEGGVELKVHRFILAVQSPVFRAMFAHKDTSEAITGRLVVEDITVEVFKLMLDYMYMDKVPNDEMMQQHGIGLLAAADKYEILELKSACSDWLAEHITSENVCKVSIAAEIHSEKELHRKCSRFITENASLVANSLGWMQSSIKQRIGMIADFEHAISLLGKCSSGQSVLYPNYMSLKWRELKRVAERYLINWTTVRNVCRLLALAEEKSAKELMNHCLRYIIGNARLVLKTQGWKTYVIETKQFNLMEKLFRAATGVSEEEPKYGFKVGSCRMLSPYTRYSSNSGLFFKKLRKF